MQCRVRVRARVRARARARVRVNLNVGVRDRVRARAWFSESSGLCHLLCGHRAKQWHRKEAHLQQETGVTRSNEE